MALTILVIADDPGSLETLRAAMPNTEFLAARDRDEALDLLERGRADFVLTERALAGAALRTAELKGMMADSLILRDACDDFERKFIRAVLEKTGWNRSEAAKALGIHRNTLLLKTNQLGVKKEKKP